MKDIALERLTIKTIIITKPKGTNSAIHFVCSFCTSVLGHILFQIFSEAKG